MKTLFEEDLMDAGYELPSSGLCYNLDPEDAKALEYLLVVDSDMDNEINLPSGKREPEFWTDSNGIKMMRRKQEEQNGNEKSIFAN